MRENSEQWSVDVLLEGTPTQAAVTLLLRNELLILVDSGWPRTRQQLILELAKRAILPEQITHVLHTHLHIDHAGNHPILTQARLLASEKEFRWADAIYRSLVQDDDDIHFITSVFPNLTGASVDRASGFIRVARGVCRKDFFSRWDEIEFYEYAEIPEGLQVVPLPGHTPGHCGIRIEGQPPTLIIGDSLDIEDTCLTRMPPIEPARFAESIHAVFAFRGRIIPGHQPAFDQF